MGDGICAVSVEMDPVVGVALAGDLVAASTVVDLLTEAVSNSVRHGGATEVVVSLAPREGAAILLAVRDNGSLAGETTQSGLGTSVLTECTLEWSRTPVDGGQLLSAVVPAASAEVEVSTTA